MEYVYDAMGMKRTIIYKEANKNMNYYPWDTSVPGPGDFAGQTKKDYTSNKVYSDNALKYILTENGYIEKVGAAYYRYYYLTDHLGNNRIVMDTAGTVRQATNYYPSGVTIAESPARSDQYAQPYKFGGKELDRIKGLDFYDFVARPYDPTLMRFTAPDPMAVKYYSVSPYAYCANNPVKFVDPKGKTIKLSGTDEFILSTLYSLQQITSTSLVLLKNGTVVEASSTQYNPKTDVKYFGGLGEGEKPFGTSTVSTLINSKHTISIVETKNYNQDQFEATNSNATKKGVGSGGKLYYNPKDDGRGQIANDDGTKGTKPIVLLGHELRHAVHSVKGIVESMTKDYILDPDIEDNWIGSRKMSKEEYNTRKEENIIRDENHLPLRKIP